MQFPPLGRDELGRLARRHLESVVAIDSASDETSTTIPSTEGQRVLSEHLRRFFEDLGAAVELDTHANMIATLAGRGSAADRPPLALMIHLDTARGTAALETLNEVPAWDGSAIPYPGNDSLRVDVEAYPATRAFVGHDLLIGDGRSPFGLDDKLGLAHLMTLAKVLADHPEIPHRPLLLIGRPDEEIGRDDALHGLAALLARRGVTSAYTVDGIAPFEVNVANFNAMGGHVDFAPRPLAVGPDGVTATFRLKGVNTHGATAKAEGHRGAVRLAAEVAGALRNLEGAQVLAFESDPERDCDGDLVVACTDLDTRREVRAVVERVVGPHVPRGAGLDVSDRVELEPDGAAAELLEFVRGFITSDGPTPILCEDSEGWEGYTQPYRARRRDGVLQLDFRVRDFDPEQLEARRAHVERVAGERPSTWSHQYENMGPVLAARPDLAEAAAAAARAAGLEPLDRPIRAGTGVDPFLEAGVFVANLGTGYFAPESEKEFTSLQGMADHARWLVALVQG